MHPTWRFIVIRWIALIAAVFTLAVCYLPAPAHAAPYGPMPKTWHATEPFYSQAMCIHKYEGAFNAATGNGYEGGFQFLKSTWESAGGYVDRKSGHWASIASPKEQLYRTWLVWKRDGYSWREWGTAGRCGLR